jgi:acyl carrier protein phosphodiesterase
VNFLAHCLIPDRACDSAHPDLIAGGFLGDFVKGRVRDDLPEPLQLGIRLHRRIDAYSNQHAGVRQSCRRFPEPLRRFAPVFVDVIADHLLARHWTRFHPLPLETFTAQAYGAIRPHVDRLPDRGRRFFDYMTDHDLLARYRETAAMHRALTALTRRLRIEHLDGALLATVDAELAALDGDFLDYLPDLIHHAAGWLHAQGGNAG